MKKNSKQKQKQKVKRKPKARNDEQRAIDQDINESIFFKEHIRRIAFDLYEWHIMLHYLWMAEMYIVKTRNNAYVKTVHNPETNSFPPKYNLSIRESIKKWCDAEFGCISEKCLQAHLKNLKPSPPYFPHDAEKEFAVTYLLGNYQKRRDAELDNRNNFHLLAAEARCLSIIYENFFEYSKKLEWSNWDLYVTIKYLTDDVMGDCHELIGYWNLSDTRKKIQVVHGRKGGKASKIKEGILQSIIDVLKDGRKDRSAEELWRHFRTHHPGEKNATEHGVYYYKDPAGMDEDEYRSVDDSHDELIEVKADGRKISIQKATFRSYVNLAKRAIKIVKK